MIMSSSTIAGIPVKVMTAGETEELSEAVFAGKSAGETDRQICEKWICLPKSGRDGHIQTTSSPFINILIC
jgi:hypothetical protein